MSTLTQFLGGKPRRQVVTLTASNASLAVPSWAQGGKGVVYVTGCGGGGSGSVSATSGQRGKGGDSAGFAVNHPTPIAAGVTTVNAQIGAGATGVTATAAANGGPGGETTLTVGTLVLRLEGGAGEGATVNGARRLAYMGAQVPYMPAGTLSGFGALSTTNPITSGGLFSGVASTLSAGAQGGDGASQNGGFGAGGQSLLGAGGAGLAAGPTSTTNGANATGYGAGGAGALSISGGAATSGAGSPGLLILEFVEGV